MAKKYFKRQYSNSSQGSRQVATWSFWVRRIDLDYDNNAHYIIEHVNDESGGVTNRWALRWRNDKFWIMANTGYWGESAQKFRDTTSWYHIVLATDLSQSNISNRLKFWVNGELQDSTGFTNIINTTGNGGFGGANERIAIGGGIVDTNTNKTMLLSQFVYVNGQQMQATDFGKTNSKGRWVAKNPTVIRTTVNSGGGFGTNGFLLPMESDVWYGNNGYGSIGSWPDRRAPGTTYRWNWNAVTGNPTSQYSSKIHAQSSDTKYADAALVSASAFGEGVTPGNGLNRWTSQNALISGNDKNVEILSNHTSYTLEFWVKKKDRNYAARQGSGVWFNINASNGANLVLFRDKNGISNGWDVYVGGAANNYIGSGYSAYNFDWQHIAWVWNGTTSKMYCDGVYVGTLTHGNVINSDSIITVFNETDSASPSMGYDNHSAGTAIESWRFVANQTLYTGGTTAGDNVFTPGDIRSATTFTTDGGSTTSSITGTVTHLFYLDKEHVSEVCKDQGRISADSTWRPNWRHLGWNRIPHLSGDSKFGKSSIQFHDNLGYGGCLVEDRCGYSGSATGSQFDNVFNGDSTIEIWFKTVNTNTSTFYPRIFDLGGGNQGNQLQIILAKTTADNSSYNTAAGCPFLWDNNASIPATRDSGPTYTDVSTVIDGEWHHYALTRSGNVWRQFLDGNLFKQNTVSVNYSPIANKSAVIGSTGDYGTTAMGAYAWPTNGGEFRGNIDQFRVVDGQALYTSNFTPGDAGSTATFSTNGTTQNGTITGQVVCLLDPDVKTAATDISTGDTISSNGFDMHNVEESGEKCLDSPDNVFCAFTDIDNTSTDGGPTNMTWGRANGMSQTVKEVYGGSMGCRSGKWYFEVLDSQAIDDWAGSGGGISIGWITAEQRRNGDTDIGGALDYGGTFSSSFGARTGANGLSEIRFQINQQTFSGTGDVDNLMTSRTINVGNTQGVGVLGVATDLDAGTITYYVNGIEVYTRTESNIGRGEHLWQPAVQLETATSADESKFSWNFGDSAAVNSSMRDSYFADENGYGRFFSKLPTGYLAICSKNLESDHNSTAITDGSQHMKCVTYTGNGSSQNVDVGFKPALLMIKHRNSNTTNPFFFDRLRGVSNATYGTLRPTTTGAATSSANYMTDFLSTADGDSVNGFTVVSAETNASGGLNVAWCWRADESFTPTGSSVSNTSGLRNTDAGFSIVKWDGASGGGNITHGLSQAPEFVIYKNIAAANNWDIYHDHISGPQKSAGDLCDGLIFTNDVPRSNSVKKPASSSMDLVDTYTNGANKVMVAYCWHSVSGYSSFGAYRATGNTIGAPDTDEAFVNTGFKPAFIVVKNVSAANDWSIRDNARSPQNPRNRVLRWNYQGSSGSAGYLEEQDATGYAIDFLANGFRIRTTGSEQGGSHGTKFIYAAWAEVPAHLANAVV